MSRPKYINGREVDTPRTNITTSELNRRNREFNEKLEPHFQRLVKLEPGRLLKPEGVGELRKSADDHVKLSSLEHSERASGPRAKKNGRAGVVASMRQWRDDGHTYDEYRHAVIAGSVDDVTIEPDDDEPSKFRVSFRDEPVGRKAISENTLEDWWTEAGKK